MLRPLPIALVLLVTVAIVRGAGPEPLAGDPFDEPQSNSESSARAHGTAYEIDLPEGFPAANLPGDYPLTNERVNLGHALFYEGSLSRNGRIQCGSCHIRKYARSDRRRFSIGLDGEATPRNSMPLFNLAWKQRFFWDGRAPSLRAQVLMPIQDPREMDESLDNVVRKLSRSATYRYAFKEAYGSEEVTAERIAVALEQFILSRVSTNSKVDRAARGELALNDLEARGRDLFTGEHRPGDPASGAGCARCHGGPLFTDFEFRNNGLPPTDDLGREHSSGEPDDRHKFATPSLRNVALTAPYMHDGRFDTLAEVVAHYSSGLHAGDTLDPGLAVAAEGDSGGLGLSEQDQAALVAFLKALSDPKFGKYE